MSKLALILIAGILLPICATAQLSKQMAKYHKKAGVTVTQLDKSLYGLYQRDNLSPDILEMLRKLDEVNILNLDLGASGTATGDKIISQFRGILDNPANYKLVKSRTDNTGEQLIYTRNKDGRVTDLVVWNIDPQTVDIIELRGDIQTDKIALLSKALNIQGLQSLATLSPRPSREDYADRMRQAAEAMRGFGGGFIDGFDSMFDGFFGSPRDTTGNDEDFIKRFMNMDNMMSTFDSHMPEQLREMMKNGAASHKMEKFFQSIGDDQNIISNSIQITEENGKTKLKIDSKNSDITYIIDGKQAPKDNIQMPEKILNVNIIPSREDMKKSYLFITSQDPLGTFTGFKNGILTFKYDNQEYRFNLDKAQDPLLVIDGRLAASFDIDPADILQIRPISQIEKEVGYYPNAAVIINTK